MGFVAGKKFSQTAWRTLSSKSPLSLEALGNVARTAGAADGPVRPPHSHLLPRLSCDTVHHPSPTDSPPPVSRDRLKGGSSRQLDNLPARLCTPDNSASRPALLEVAAQTLARRPVAPLRPYLTLASAFDSNLVGLASSGAQQVMAGSSTVAGNGGLRRPDMIPSRPSTHPHRHLFSLVGGQPADTAEPRRYSETRVIG